MRLGAFLARAGVASRRESERLVWAGLVRVNGEIIKDPAKDVSGKDIVCYKDETLSLTEKARVWCYFKPKGLVTTHKDPEGRPTVFDDLHQRYTLPRVISVGRLDINSEGLLLITNNSAFANRAETSPWPRRYRVRILGNPSFKDLERIKKGTTVDGIHYAPLEIDYEPSESANQWLFLTLFEGKNREIRHLMEHIGCKVNRLIRVGYGSFELGNLTPHGLIEQKHTQEVF